MSDYDEYLCWEIAKETGWTLEYIRTLPEQDIRNYTMIKDAKAKADR